MKEAEAETLAERAVRRFFEAISKPIRETPVVEKEELFFPSMEALYGVPLYVVGEGYVGQIRRFYILRSAESRKWFFETCACIVIYGVRENLVFPVVVMGLPTKWAYERYEQYLVEECEPRRSVEVDERELVNLERVMKAEDPVLIADKYGLYKRSVPQEYWGKYVEMQNMIANLQKTVYDLEHDRSELITNLRMRETENMMLRKQLEDLRSELVKLRAETTNYYLEYQRLKNEVRLQTEIADFLESMFNRLRARIRQLERRVVTEERGEGEEKGEKE